MTTKTVAKLLNQHKEPLTEVEIEYDAEALVYDGKVFLNKKGYYVQTHTSLFLNKK